MANSKFFKHHAVESAKELYDMGGEIQKLVVDHYSKTVVAIQWWKAEPWRMDMFHMMAEDLYQMTPEDLASNVEKKHDIMVILHQLMMAQLEKDLV